MIDPDDDDRPPDDQDDVSEEFIEGTQTRTLLHVPAIVTLLDEELPDGT